MGLARRLLLILCVAFLSIQPPAAEANLFTRACSWAYYAVMGKGSKLPMPPVPKEPPPADAIVNIETAELGKKIGEGGFGAAYVGKGFIPGRAEPVELVLKEVFARRNRGGVEGAEGILRREHDAYVQVHPYDGKLVRIDGKLFFAQRLIRARPDRPNVTATTSTEFFDLEPDRAFDRPFKAKIVDSALDGLEAIHARDLVFNDIKPGNILISSDGVAHIVDYGVVTKKGAEVSPEMGTITHLSPGRLYGVSEARARDDVYALGLVMLEVEMGAEIESLRAYRYQRAYGTGKFWAFARLPDENPERIKAERAMAHFTFAKTSVADYRALLKAADESPAAFATKYAEMWTAAYQAEKNDFVKDYLRYEIFMAPQLGPKLVMAIKDKKLREEIVRAGIAQYPDPGARNLAVNGWHKNMKPMIKEFLESPVLKDDAALSRILAGEWKP